MCQPQNCVTSQETKLPITCTCGHVYGQYFTMSNNVIKIKKIGIGYFIYPVVQYYGSTVY